MAFECPDCGSREKLRGSRRADDVVDIECLACGREWAHDPWRCDRCGGRLDPVRKPLLQKARGTQQSIIGFRIAKECRHCDTEPPDMRAV